MVRVPECSVDKGFAKVKTMYPLLLKPPIKDYLWGGTKLKTDFGFETEKDIVAEAWMLSCHKDGTNTVINGKYKGKRLDEILKLWGYSDKFPILIKLIDAKQKLSVQVHPDDSYALEYEGEYGKTEMWYVVDCEPGAQLAYGFKKDIDKAEFECRIKDNTLDDIINYVPVKKGDVFFIAAGTLHAIGEGILIAEVQQNSNTTYRVSDYGRLGADGKPRELHIDKALDVTKLEKPSIPYGNVGNITKHDYGTERELADCDFFKVKIIELEGLKKINNENTLISILLLQGEIIIKYSKGQFSMKKGDSVLIPIGCSAKLIGKAEMLLSTY